MSLGMRFPVLALAIAFSTFGCESKKSPPEPGATTEKRTPGGQVALVDVTAASGLVAVRTAFNAHKGEARFLTLLSPT